MPTNKKPKAAWADEPTPLCDESIFVIRDENGDDNNCIGHRGDTDAMNPDTDDYIKMEDCVPRGVYRVDGRNFSVGVCVVKPTSPGAGKPETGFIGLRYEFGLRIDTELHWDADEHYGTVKPLELLHMLPDDIEASENRALFDYLEQLHKNHE